jgi:hypothetical protein
VAELLESVAERVVVKAYASASIDPSVAAVSSSALGASDGQVLRHVSHNLSLQKDVYAEDEVRTDRTRPMEKHGTRRVPGNINGLLSAGTYELLMEAILQGTWNTTAVSGDETDFTSCAADNTTAKFTLGGGNPVTEGFRVGDIIRFTNLSAAANNATNFVILGFGGSNNREITVFPAPTTHTADTEFDVTTVGGRVSAPASGHVKRKFGIEVYNSDGDISRLFTEGRFSGFDLSVSPNQMARINFSGLWRNREVYSGSDAPFFTSPVAETTTDVISSMAGLLRINGATVAVVTAFSFSFNRAPTAPAQIHAQGLTPGILLANAVVTGSFTAFLQDTTMMDAYDDEDEIELLIYLPETNEAAPHAVTFYLPRIKLNSNNETTIEGAKAIECGFTAGRYFGSGAGIESTVLRICDTAVTS